MNGIPVISLPKSPRKKYGFLRFSYRGKPRSHSSFRVLGHLELNRLFRGARRCAGSQKILSVGSPSANEPAYCAWGPGCIG